jgi:hypothetical protein
MRGSVLVCLLLAGCIAPWSKPGGTPEALDTDEAACHAAVMGQYPPLLGAAPASSLGIATPGYTCLPNRGCVPTSPSYVPPQSEIDVNQAPRDAAFAQCLEQKGWSR